MIINLVGSVPSLCKNSGDSSVLSPFGRGAQFLVKLTVDIFSYFISNIKIIMSPMSFYRLSLYFFVTKANNTHHFLELVSWYDDRKTRTDFKELISNHCSLAARKRQNRETRLHVPGIAKILTEINSKSVIK